MADQENVDVEHIVQDAGTENIKDFFGNYTVRRSDHYSPSLFVEKDNGMYDAVNRGLRRTNGEICAYLNCDEQYLPGTLHKVLKYFSSHPKIDILFGDAILVNADGVPLSYRRTTLPSRLHLQVADLNTLTCATFFRRRILEAGHFFPTHLKIAGDQYWVFRLLESQINMGLLREPLSIFAFTGSNLSHAPDAVDERLAWLSPQERPNRWFKPFGVARHRFGKLLAGAYRRRDVTVEIYTKEESDRRRKITARVGFRWPRTEPA